MSLKRILFVSMLIIAMMSVTLLSAATKKVTLRLAWWGNPTRDERTMKVVELYMAKNPGVTIETETTGWASYWDKLGSQAAARNLPDIIQQDYTYITGYANKKLLLDLSSYVISKKIDLTGVADTFTSGGKVNGKLYGISLGTNAVCFILDPAVIAKAGLTAPGPNWTMSDFEKMATTIFQKTGVQIPVFSPTDPKVQFNDWVRQNNELFFNKEGTAVGFKAPILVEFFQTQLRLLKSGVMTKPDISFMQVTPQESPLTKGQEWQTMVWSNQVVMTQAPMNRPISVVLLPKIANSKKSGTFLKPSMFFSVTNTSANKEEAVKFLNFFINDIEANKILLAERGIPIVPKVREALKGIVDPINKQIFEFIDLAGNKNSSSIDPADPVGSGEVLKIFRTIDQEVLYGTTSPKDGADKFIKQANIVLAKNKTK
jgi:multiple sugar transport system substrate-binding protein